jgi:hypothetical protein
MGDLENAVSRGVDRVRVIHARRRWVRSRGGGRSRLLRCFRILRHGSSSLRRR